MSAENVLRFLLVDLVIIIAAARLFGWLARRLGQPSVIGEILAGILLGPTVLGRIHAAWPGQLFPSQVPLQSFADVGLVFFMFLVGLELDPRLVRAQGRRAAQISLSGIALPLAGGMAAGLLLRHVNDGGRFLTGMHSSRPVAFVLFLGAAMCITAFPVLARILVETGLYRTAVGTAALCAAALDDVSAWLLLAAVVGITNSGSAGAAGLTFLLLLVYVAAMLLIVRPLLRYFAERFDRTGRLSVDQVAVVLGGVLVSAYVTQKIGVHYVFGAFVFGLIMPQQAAMTRELTDKIEDFTAIVLLPVFFLITGLHTNLFTINSPALFGWLLLLLAVAMAGKLLGCGLAARLTGASTRDSLVIGALMNTRGLTELVILSIGLNLGVLSDRVFAMMVLMALFTTVLAAPLVNRLMPRSRIIRELAGVGADPTHPPAVRVLVILGNPANAPALVEVGALLAGTARPAELLLVRLIPTPRAPQFRTGLHDEERDLDAALVSLDGLVQQATALGVRARPLSWMTDDLTADLVRVAADQRCDLIVSGWHRPSIEQSVVRRSVQRLFREAPCAVAVFVDRQGLGIRRAPGGVVELLLTGSRVDAGATQVADALAAALQAPAPVAIESGVSPSPHAEVLVIGIDGGAGSNEDFGPLADSVAKDAACPLLVVRPAATPAG